MSQAQTRQHQRIGYAIKRLQQALRVAMDAALVDYQLTMAQFAALKALEAGPLSPAELARRCFTTRQSMHDVLTCLHDRTFIENAPRQGRRQPVTLTLTGRQALSAADHAVESLEARITHGLTPPQQHRLATWLNRCAANLEALQHIDDSTADTDPQPADSINPLSQ